MSRTSPTLAQIAADYTLWGEYFDVDGHDTLEQWEQMGQSARVEMLRYAFDDPYADGPSGRLTVDADDIDACRLLADLGITLAKKSR